MKEQKAGKEGNERSGGRKNVQINAQRNKQAYMTVEASLILPFSVALIALLLYLSFYLYAVCFLNEIAYVAALRASLLPAGADRAAAAQRELDALWEGCVLSLRQPERNVSASLLAVEVSLCLEFPLPVPEFLPIEIRNLRVQAEKKALVRDAVSFIRGVRLAGGLAGT